MARFSCNFTYHSFVVTETKKSKKKQEESPSKGTDIKEMGDSASR